MTRAGHGLQHLVAGQDLEAPPGTGLSRPRYCHTVRPTTPERLEAGGVTPQSKTAGGRTILVMAEAPANVQKADPL